MKFRKIDDGLWEVFELHLTSHKPYVGRPRTDRHAMSTGFSMPWPLAVPGATYLGI